MLEGTLNVAGPDHKIALHFSVANNQISLNIGVLDTYLLNLNCCCWGPKNGCQGYQNEVQF